MASWTRGKGGARVRVAKGDTIVQVNDVRGTFPHLLLGELGKNESLELTLRKEIVSPAEATQSIEALEVWLANADGTHALTLPDASGMRLTHWAASGGYIDVLQLLVQKGADPWDGTATPEEHSSLHMASHSGHTDVVQYMLSELARRLRSRGALTVEQAANARDKKDATCLHLAATAGHAEVLKQLASARADLGAQTARSGTALHVAAAVGQVDAVQALLDIGADVCAKNKGGETPGMRAREEEMNEVVALLIEKEDRAGCGMRKRSRRASRRKQSEL